MIPSRETPARRPVRRAGRRKVAALEAAIAVIAERGADSTRFTDVAEASGVPVSTLQYYFGSRDDLLLAAFRHASLTELADLRQQVEAIPGHWEQLVHIVDVALAGYAPPDARAGRLWMESWRFALHDQEMRADVLDDYAAWRLLLAEAIRRGANSGAFHPVASPEEIAIAILGLTDGIGLPLALADPPVSAASANQTVQLTLRALLGLATTAGLDRSSSATPAS
jgi:AcrR family transcriptional regulator